MKILGEGLGALFALGLIFWAAALYIADENRRPVVACMPVHYAVLGAGKVQIAVSEGSTDRPNDFPWQDKARMGCLKFANRILAPSN